jgi:hypothetical protein
MEIRFAVTPSVFLLSTLLQLVNTCQYVIGGC